MRRFAGLVFVLASAAHAAETFDHFSYSGEKDNVTSYTWNHNVGTCGTSHGAITVITSATSTAHGAITGVTVGGNAMTQVGFVDSTNSTTVAWKLVDPPTGASVAIVVSRGSANVGNLAVAFSACGISTSVVRAGSFVTNTVEGSETMSIALTPTVAADLDVLHIFCASRSSAIDAFKLNGVGWTTTANFQAGNGNDNVDLDLLSGMWAPNSTSTLTLSASWSGANGCSAAAFSFDLNTVTGRVKHKVVIE